MVENTAQTQVNATDRNGIQRKKTFSSKKLFTLATYINSINRKREHRTHDEQKTERKETNKTDEN